LFRIRRVYDDVVPSDREAVAAVQTILRQQFSAVPDEEVRKLPRKLREPRRYGFRHLLFVAENGRGEVRGFALLLHEPELSFCFLDYIAAATWQTGSGVGGALYERVRHEASALVEVGLFFECLPDDPAECATPEVCRQNKARLKFYESYGARPIINTAYETPIRLGQSGLPHLVFDDLDRRRPLRRAVAQQICRTILERKYGHVCSPEYVKQVVSSFRDDPVRLRPFCYLPPASAQNKTKPATVVQPITLVVNDRHEIHHIRERGYVQAPVRVASILKELDPTGLCRRIEPLAFPTAHIRAIHDGDFVSYLECVCQRLSPERAVYPYVFPIRNMARPPKELAVRAGYYCIDTFTPLTRNAFIAAKRAVDCTLTAAEALIRGERLVYALVRPPGHHAERRVFGGFCYFNNGAIAAQYLGRLGRVAILDVDYHHGNGHQDIFYNRRDVLTISIHGHPSFAYPYFSGFEEETGTGPGIGFNCNYPLPESVDGKRYRRTLEQALDRIRAFSPVVLIVSLGLDTAKGDPTGTWSLRSEDFRENGRMIGGLHLPTLLVQEGGYRTRTLGINARSFCSGLVETAIR